MQWAAARGLRQVNLGGADPDTPLARFKEQWGAEPRTRFRLTHRAGGEQTQDGGARVDRLRRRELRRAG